MAVVMMITTAFFIPTEVLASDVATSTDAVPASDEVGEEEESKTIINNHSTSLNRTAAVDGSNVTAKSNGKNWSNGIASITGTEWASASGNTRKIEPSVHNMYEIIDKDGKRTVAYCMQPFVLGPDETGMTYTNGHKWVEQIWGEEEGNNRINAMLGAAKFIHGGTNADPNVGTWKGDKTDRNVDDGGTFGTYLIGTKDSNNDGIYEDLKAVRGLMIAGKVYEMTDEEARALSSVVVHSIIADSKATSIIGTSGRDLTPAYNHLMGIANGTYDKVKQYGDGIRVDMDTKDYYSCSQKFTWEIYNTSTGAWDAYTSTDTLDKKYVSLSDEIKLRVKYTSYGLCNNLTQTTSSGNMTVKHNFSAFNVGASSATFNYFDVIEGSGNNVPFTVTYDKITAGYTKEKDFWFRGTTEYKRNTFSQVANITVDAGEFGTSDKKLSIGVVTETGATNALTKTTESGKTVYSAKMYQNTDRQDMLFLASNRSVSANSAITLDIELTGSIKIHKYSANAEITTGNKCYDLTGANFAVFKTRAQAEAAAKENNVTTANANAIAVIVTDKDGNGEVTSIPRGTYYVVETKAPKNYRKNDKVYTANVTSDVPVEFNVPNEPANDPAEVIARKKDADKEIYLADAIFVIKYYDVELTNGNLVDPATLGETPDRTWYLKTDKEGYASLSDKNYILEGSDALYYQDENNEFPVIPVGTITVQEESAPAGYIKDDTVYPFSIVDNPTGIPSVEVLNERTIPNEMIKGKIGINKKAQVFTWDDTSKEYSATWENKSGVNFDVIAAEDIMLSEEVTLVTKGTVVDTITTDSNGYAETDKLYLGNYTLREITPSGYIKNDDIPVEITLDDTVKTETVNGTVKQYVYTSVDVVNYQQNVEIKVYKTDDSKTVLLEGAKFGLYKADSSLKTKDDYIKSGIKLEEGVTDAKGELVFKNKYPVFDKYVVIELEAPAGYIMNNEAHVLTPEPTSNGIEYVVIEDAFINNEITGQIRITKQAEQFNYNGKEYEPSKIKLQGVTFSVIAAEDIKTDDGAVVAKKGTVVETIKTDANGAAKTSTGLYMGKYILRETTPTGYIKNDDIPVTLSISDNKASETVNGVVKPYVYKSVNVVNYQQKVEIKVYKTDDSKTVLLEGAKFGLYKADSSLKTKDDYIKSGIKLEEGVTDAKGELVFKNKYPVFDKYVVIELEAPEGYVMNDEVHVLTPEPTSDGIEYVVIEDEFVNKIKKQAFQIIKYGETKDGGKNPLAGAGFSVCKVDELKEVSKDYEPADGEVIVTSDEGKFYIWDSSKVVVLTSDGKTEIFTDAKGYAESIELEYGKYIGMETTVPATFLPVDEFTINVIKDSREAIKYEFIDKLILTGRIDIHKTGEDRTYNEELGEFENKEIVLEGIQFDIFAAEDLYDIHGNLKYAAGTLVETITTDANGDASTSDTLPLGNFRIHEKNVPAGYEVMEDVYVTLSRDNDTVRVTDENGAEKQIVYSVLQIKNKLLIPEIKTTAKDSVTLNNVADPSATTTSIDTISHTNLIPDKEYEIKTVLLDKETQKPLIIDGKEITGTTKYKPVSASGQVDVSVTYNSSLLAGKQVVFFEYIYTDGKLVALHADINDGGQTITYPPETPPNTPPTGDGAPLGLIICLMVLAGAGLIGLICFKKLPKKIK